MVPSVCSSKLIQCLSEENRWWNRLWPRRLGDAQGDTSKCIKEEMMTLWLFRNCGQGTSQEISKWNTISMGLREKEQWQNHEQTWVFRDGKRLRLAPVWADDRNDSQPFVVDWTCIIWSNTWAQIHCKIKTGLGRNFPISITCCYPWKPLRAAMVPKPIVRASIPYSSHSKEDD